MPLEGSVETGNAHWTIGGEMDGLENAVRKAKQFVVGNFSELSSTVGTIFLGIGAAAAAAFAGIGAAALGVAGDVQSATGKIQAQLGLAEDQAARFADTIKQVYGNNFGESISDVGDAVAATFNGLQNVLGDAEVGLQQNTERAIALRDAFGVEVAGSIDAVSALIQNFGINADQAFDFVTAGFQRGLNKSDDFLDSITEYSNQFADGGADAGQFFSLLESGLGSGVLGTDKAADAFKEFRIRISEGSDAAAEALQQIGLNAAAFQAEIANGQKTAAQAFEEVLAGLRGTDDETVRFNAGVALLGTQFEDLGESAALGLSLTGTTLEDLAGSTEILNEQYDNLGSAVEGLRRKFFLALEPIGQALLEVINQYLPDIEGAFNRLSELGPQFAEIFASALDAILNTIVPVTVATIEFVSEHSELIASIVEFTIQATPYLLALGSILKVVGLITSATTLFGGSTAAAAGAGGMGAMTIAAGSLGGALLPIFGAAGIIPFAVISLGLFLRGLADVKVAEEKLVESNQDLEAGIERRLAQLRELGVVVDENHIRSLDLAVQAQALSDAEDDARAETLRGVIEHFAQRAATEEEFVQARNIALNDYLTQEEAAQIALLEIDTATKNALLRADEGQTEALLVQLGLRTAAKQVAIEEDLLGAITAAEFQKAIEEDLTATQEGALAGRFDVLTNFLSDLGKGSFALRSDMSADAVATRQAQAAAAEEARAAYVESFARSSDAATLYSDLLVELTRADADAYKALDETQQESVDSLVSNMADAGKTVDQIATAVRESLKKLSLDHRESPSINDLVGESLGTFSGMMEDHLTRARETLEGLRGQWFDTWGQIGDFVSSTLNFLFDQAQAFINSLGFALGGVAQVLAGGFASGGVVGYAGGGSVRPLVPVVANEHGLEPMFLPQGTRIIAHGEAIQALERGAQSNGVSVNLGGAQFIIRNEADVAAISRGIGNRVFDRLSQMGLYRGLTQTG